MAFLVLAIAFAGIGLGSRARADDSFSKTLSPADFQSAGLGKLTPDELARLDELVRARQTGQVARAKEEAKVEAKAEVRQEVTAQVRQEVKEQVKAEVKEEVKEEVKAEVKAEVRAEVRKEVQAEVQAAPAKPSNTASFIDRFKVILKPGTEVTYTTLDSKILPPFHGWHNGTQFTLENGQIWVVTDDSRYFMPTVTHPVPVKIVPGSLGSFFMEIEHGGRPRVKFQANTAVATPPSTSAAPPQPAGAVAPAGVP